MLNMINEAVSAVDTKLYDIPANEHLMSEAAAARYLGCSSRSLQGYRSAGCGPVYRRIGKRRIAYLRADLVAYIAGRGHSSTSEEGYRRSRR